MNIGLLLNAPVQNNNPLNLMITDYSTDDWDLEAFSSGFNEIIRSAMKNKPKDETIDVNISVIKKENSSNNPDGNSKILKISVPGIDKGSMVELEKLKKINGKLYEFVSLLLLMNINRDINPDSLKLEVTGKNIVLSGIGLNITLDEKSISSFTERILSSLESSINELISRISTSPGVSGENPDSAKAEKANINLKDVFADLILDAVKKVISSDLNAGSTAEPETIVFNHLENAVTEVVSQSSVQTGLSAQSQSVGEEINVTDIQPVKTESLKQVIKELLSEMGVDEEIGDIEIKVFSNSTDSDNANIEAEKTRLINFVKKFIPDFTGIAKHLVRDITKAINYINVREIPQVPNSNHIIRPVRNAGFFDFGKTEFLSAAAMQQPIQEINPQSIGTTEGFQINGPNINPADIVSQISSGIFDKNAQLVKEVQIRLKPESLGVIKIKIETVENGVSIRIQTQYSHTEEIISSNLHMLKNSLSENGIPLKDLIVLSELNLNNEESTGWSGFGNFMQNNPGPVFSEGNMASNTSLRNSNIDGEIQRPDDSSSGYQNPYHVDIVV